MGTKPGIARALARAPGFRSSYILGKNPCHRGLVDTLSGFNDAPSHPGKADSSMLSCQMALDMMPISQADMSESRRTFGRAWDCDFHPHSHATEFHSVESLVRVYTVCRYIPIQCTVSTLRGVSCM